MNPGEPVPVIKAYPKEDGSVELCLNRAAFPECQEIFGSEKSIRFNLDTSMNDKDRDDAQAIAIAVQNMVHGYVKYRKILGPRDG